MLRSLEYFLLVHLVMTNDQNSDARCAYIGDGVRLTTILQVIVFMLLCMRNKSALIAHSAHTFSCILQVTIYF